MSCVVIVVLQKVIDVNFNICSSEISALFYHISDPETPGFISSVGYLQEE